MKIWYKTVAGEKITGSEIREFNEKMTEESFLVQLRDVCDKLNVSTPVMLATHFKHFVAFNVVHFKRDDFIDSVDFDRMDVEIVRDKKQNQKYGY